MVVCKKGAGTIWPNMKVKNRKHCSTYRTKTKAIRVNTDNSNSCYIEVREMDFPGRDEWVVYKAYLYNVTSSGAYEMSWNSSGEGPYFNCGNYGKRCTYTFKLQNYLE